MAVITISNRRSFPHFLFSSLTLSVFLCVTESSIVNVFKKGADCCPCLYNLMIQDDKDTQKQTKRSWERDDEDGLMQPRGS